MLALSSAIQLKLLEEVVGPQIRKMTQLDNHAQIHHLTQQEEVRMGHTEGHMEGMETEGHMEGTGMEGHTAGMGVEGHTEVMGMEERTEGMEAEGLKVNDT